MNIYPILWTIFAVVWIFGWLQTKSTQERAPLSARLRYGVPMLAGSYLIAISNPFYGRLHTRIIPSSTALQGTALVLTMVGIAFAIWARFYIGQNWSGAVTVKVGHELIRSGPYAWVRHPIYSGILLAIIGTTLARGKLSGLLAIPLFFIGFLIKSRMEEQFMRKTFGEQYLEYSRSTGALFPKIGLRPE